MKKNVIVAALILAAAAGGARWWMTHSSAAGAAEAGAGAVSAASAASGASSGKGGPQTVGVTLAQQRDVPINLEAAGTVVALESADVRPQVSGLIAEVAIHEGQMVRKGDVLFRLDDRADKANVDKAVAQLQRDKATLADIERQLRRARELVEQEFMSRGAVETLQAQLDAQRATVQASAAAVKAAEVSLSNTVLRSPMSGRAGAINAIAGTLVQPSGPALVSLSQIDPIGVSFTLPEGQLGALRRAEKEAREASKASPESKDKPKDSKDTKPTPGPKADKPAAPGVALTVQMPGERRSQPGQTLAGTVSFIDNAVDSTTGTIRVKGSVPNTDKLLWPGQYVTVKLTLRTIKDAIVIPQAALIIRGNERSVYVVDAEGKAQLKPVQVRQPLGENIAVEGVSAGEKIVVEGKQNLRPGTVVKEVALKAGKGASAAGAGPEAASGAASGAVSSSASAAPAASATAPVASGASQ